MVRPVGFGGPQLAASQLQSRGAPTWAPGGQGALIVHPGGSLDAAVWRADLALISSHPKGALIVYPGGLLLAGAVAQCQYTL